jgi:hypothetical protein
MVGGFPTTASPRFCNHKGRAIAERSFLVANKLGDLAAPKGSINVVYRDVKQ